MELQNGELLAIAHVDLLKEFAYVRKYDNDGVTIISAINGWNVNVPTSSDERVLKLVAHSQQRVTIAHMI